MLLVADRPPPFDPIDYYDRGAAHFSARYDSVSFERVHDAIASFVPPVGSAVLDVGAGSGRDARALAAMGLRVTAVEPAAKMRIMAINQSKIEGIRWFNDRLPTLESLQDEKYALILCSAVLMLLPAVKLVPSLKRMGALLDEGGYLAISVRNTVPGEPDGLVHAHSSAKILATASAAGLVSVLECTLPDALGREKHDWRSFVFERVK